MTLLAKKSRLILHLRIMVILAILKCNSRYTRREDDNLLIEVSVSEETGKIRFVRAIIRWKMERNPS